MSYQPFLIAPFGTGLDTDMAPWLLPQDAFSNIVNGHIHHGVVEKRDGYTKQGDIVHQDQTNWKITGVTQANPGVVTMTSAAGLTNGDIVEIRNVTGMTELNGNQYTVANVGATTFELSGVDTTLFTAWAASGDVYHIPGNRTMGLHRRIDSANVKEVIAFNQRRASKFNPTNNEYDPLDSVDIMDAGAENTDYIWADNWASTASSAAATQYRLYFTNGRAYSAGPPEVNGIRYYDGGTTTTLFRPQINSMAFINGCKLLFAFRQRLVLLHTIEDANTYPQRARWCQAQKPGDPAAFAGEWDDNIAGRGGFVDAPTGDHIISAEFVQDILIVYFTNSVWTLRPTADPALPFRWDKINDFRACDSKMSVEQFDRYVVSAGIRGITATDGVETRRFDERIEDFVDNDINNDQFEKVFSRRSFGNRRMWMLYPPRDEVDPDTNLEDAIEALIYDEGSSAFSKYAISMNVLGYGGAAQDSDITDFGDKTLDQFADDTLTDYFFDEGSEIFLGGDRAGVIWTLEQGGDDSETLFEAVILNVTQANPAVVTMTGDVGLSNGDIVTISGIAAGSMVELNSREFIVAGKAGNSFQLQGIDSTGFAAYVAGSAGDIRNVTADSIRFRLDSAAWNPWMSEGKQSQLGYIDLFMDTHDTSTIEVSFFTNNDETPYVTKKINLLPNLTERGGISNITNASPGNVTAAGHALNTGDVVFIYNVEGMAAVNGGPYTVTVVDLNNFTIGVDTTNYGIYQNGGVITELEYSTEKAWKRIYAGGTGYQHRIRVEQEGRDRPLNIHAFMPWFKPRAVRPI